MDISSTVEVDSTQVNADDLIASPRTVTVTGVSEGSPDQPVNIELDEFPGRVYRPCKSMRRVLIVAWGADASAYIGRRLTLYNDPTVKWAGSAVGGIRIKAMSHIEKRITVSLTVTRGKRSPFVVEPLQDDAPPAKPTLIPEATVAEFERRIVEADSVPGLDTIAGDLKAYELGAHRDHLLSLWSERKSEIVMDASRDAETATTTGE